MTWIKIKENLLICLETSQEIRLIKSRKGFEIWLSNWGIIRSFEDSEKEANDYFGLLVNNLEHKELSFFKNKDSE